MAPVLDIDSLLESPLSDLHALAGELDIEGYRLLRKADLTIAILESRGAIADEIRPKVEAKAAELAAQRAERERIAAEREAAEEEAREAAAQERRERTNERSGARGERQRGQRGGRNRGGRGGERRPGERAERGGERQPRERAGREQREREGAGRQSRDRGRDQGQGRGAKAPAAAEAEATVTISGVFEPGSGGGGRLRTDLSRRVRGDADVQRGEVRKWRLHRGDTVTGEARKLKRGRTDFQLAGITSVNGLNAEQRAASKVRFSEAEVAEPGTRFAKRSFKHAPVLAGSRVIVTGPTRAAAAEMTDRLAAELAGSGITTTVVVTVARPQAASPPKTFCRRWSWCSSAPSELPSPVATRRCWSTASIYFRPTRQPRSLTARATSLSTARSQ
ncbi:MAG: Rho termination factor N-terminal domain-containing protein [Actinobacteria bacterium]|nr:Rho termination factor N-terminal domain-containing protein [Actinomycetota bacterium]